MIDGFAARLGGVDQDFQILFDLVLTDILFDPFRAQGQFKLAIVFGWLGGNNAIGHKTSVNSEQGTVNSSVDCLLLTAH